MPNSADKSSRQAALPEDSDVIELTDEVRAAAEASIFGELDGLDFAMPEFKLPELSDFEEDERASSSSHAPSSLRQTLPLDAAPRPLDDAQHDDDDDDQFEPTAILPPSARPLTEEIDLSQEMLQPQEPLDAPVDYSSRSTHKTMQIDLNDLKSLEEVSFEEMEPEPESEPASAQAPHYDRQDMVRTLQMQAVDRDAIERQIELERVVQSSLVQEHTFAPDILASPPRALTRRWQEWPLEAPSPKPREEPAPAAPIPSLKATQTPGRPTHPSGPLPQMPPQAQRPPTGQVPALGRPSSPTPAPLPALSRAPAGSTPAPAPAPAFAAPASAAKPSTGDTELDGLVQELLDESAKKEQAKQARAKARIAQPGRDSWFKDVFNDEYFRTLTPGHDRQTERELEFIDDCLSLAPGARLLDLACGYGRHAIGMAQRQIEVVGLDLSMDMLQRGLAQAQRRSLSIKFIHADMRSLSFQDVFDGCLLWQSSFGYFDDITNFKVLQGVWRALKPGARFLIDVLNRDHVVAQMPSRCWWEGQGCIFLEEVDFDFAQSVLHTKRSFIYEDGSPPLEQNTYIRLYSVHEIANLVTNAGFRVLELSGELHHRGRFLGPSNPRLILLAEKILPPQKKP